MRLLLDTNIFLEVILEQDAANQARAVLQASDQHDLFVSDYSLHSIGLLLFRRGDYQAFLHFVADLIQAPIIPLSVEVQDLPIVVDAAQKFRLDFDDAYQYAAAQQQDLVIVSFDRDFDRTERGRKTPGEVAPA